MGRQKIVILGVTGSIGVSALKVLDACSNQFELTGISYHENDTLAREICQKYKVSHLCCTSPEKRDEFPEGIAVHPDLKSLLDIDYDAVLIAVVGAVGVMPAYYAALAGKRILLANKESLVMAGSFIIEAARKNGAELLPVDSEHNSVFRLLEGQSSVQKVIITASGGALREYPLVGLAEVSVENVLKHPTWSMGAKITVDSATMVNKALELIEAHYLFELSYEKLDALIHPQSFVHAILQARDGSYSFHVYEPDMVYSIAHTLFYPESAPPILKAAPVDEMPALTFQPIEKERYPAFFLGVEAGKEEGVFPAIFNAANEEAVAAFLDERIGYMKISSLIEEALEGALSQNFGASMEDLFAADEWAREFIRQRL